MNESGIQPVGEHAVVIGASMAGLLATCSLAERFRQVTIVDRDVLPAIGEGRRAVPQGRHAHGLLASGERAIETLLPGITAELIDAGARSCASMREVRMVVAGHLITREAVGADVLLASRPLIEGLVRRRVLAIGNVSVRERCDTVDLLTTPDRSRVTGIAIHNRGDGTDEALTADLVIAATGRDARVPTMLQALGYPRPKENRLAVDLRYVSRRVRIRPEVLGADKVVLIGPRPGRPRGMMLMEQEDHWILTACGYGSEHRPPTDENGYLTFLASVAPPDVLTAIRAAEPLSDLVSHGFPANLRRRYERVRRFPDGLLVTGDAICSFNPLYGQGMSVAALEAVALRGCLADGERRLARRYFRAAGKIVDQAWDAAVGGDLALPEVAGTRSPATRIGNAYVERILQAAEHDPIVAATFGEVNDLMASPQDLTRPRFVLRVLRSGPARPPATRDPVPADRHPLLLELSRRAVTKAGRPES